MRASQLRKEIWIELRPINKRLDAIEAANAKARENKVCYLVELLLGWLLAKRNGGEYYFMEGER